MRNKPVLTATEVAALIPDDAVVSVSSSSALGCPDFVLQGIGEAFERTGSPRNLTTVHPIAAGDMYGVLGIDHIARPGLLSRIIAGSYPSGPSAAERPRIWQLIEDDDVEAYNLPSGVLFQMHRAGASGQPGVLTKVGLDTFVDPRREGGQHPRPRTGHESCRDRERCESLRMFLANEFACGNRGDDRRGSDKRKQASPLGLFEPEARDSEAQYVVSPGCPS